MSTASRAVLVLALLMLVAPAPAYAAGTASIVPPWLPFVGGLIGLIVAVALLLEVLRLRRLAFGAALSERTGYVVGAVVCLAASALVHWIGNFLPALTVAQSILASNLLVAAAMAMLVLYFSAVRRTLTEYARALASDFDVDETYTAEGRDPDGPNSAEGRRVAGEESDDAGDDEIVWIIGEPEDTSSG